jgi:hypothetical protein
MVVQDVEPLEDVPLHASMTVIGIVLDGDVVLYVVLIQPEHVKQIVV